MPIFRRHEEAPRERTPEERERARLEREARRTGRPLPSDGNGSAGNGLPERDFEIDDPPELAAQPVAEEPEGPEEPDWEPELHHAEPEWEDDRLRDVSEERDDFAGGGAEFAPEPRSPAPEPRSPAPAEPQHTEPFDPLRDGEGDAVAERERPGPERDAVVEPEPLAEEVEPEPLAEEVEPEPLAEEVEPEPEPPRIVPPAARRAAGERPAPATYERRLPPTPPPPGAPAFTKRRRRRGRILAFVALLVIGALLFGLSQLFQPFHGDGGEEVTVRIPTNSSIAEVGDILAEEGIVDSSVLFRIRAELAGADLKAGTHRLRRDSSYGDALDVLTGNPAAPRTIKVAIPEGRSRNETAPLIEEAGLEGSYLKASDRRSGFDPSRYGAPRRTRTLEGFLFPATYELRPSASAATLVDQQLEAFERTVRKVDMRRAERRNLSVYDVLIIASMVEREASLARERPIIAAVIHNRLRQGMPLGIDATIRYVTRNWQRPIRQSELRLDSPYNTYRRTGLPPTPIGSPGLDSIRAAANPANVDYLYYVIKPGGDGAHNFSSTDAEFQRDVEAYNRERERRGGRSPASSDG